MVRSLTVIIALGFVDPTEMTSLFGAMANMNALSDLSIRLPLSVCDLHEQTNKILRSVRFTQHSAVY
jgi:hypothetical protein